MSHYIPCNKVLNTIKSDVMFELSIAVLSALAIAALHRLLTKHSQRSQCCITCTHYHHDKLYYFQINADKI